MTTSCSRRFLLCLAESANSQSISPPGARHRLRGLSCRSSIVHFHNGIHAVHALTVVRLERPDLAYGLRAGGGRGSLTCGFVGVAGEIGALRSGL